MKFQIEIELSQEEIDNERAGDEDANSDTYHSIAQDVLAECVELYRQGRVGEPA